MTLVAVDLDVEIVQVPHELRVDALHVVALVERVDGCLPVAVPLDRDVARERHPVKVVRVEMLRHRVEVLEQRLGIRVQAEPDETAPGCARQLRQAATRRCSLRKRVEIRNALERTVERVFPVVVLALERLGAADARRAQPIPAVHADVVERAHAAVRLTHEQHRLAPDLRADVIAGLAAGPVSRPPSSQTRCHIRSHSSFMNSADV